MSEEIWVLGATGRTGRAIAVAAGRTGAELVLVSRDQDRVDTVAQTLGATARGVAASLDTLASELKRAQPAVVINTIGPFVMSAPRVIDALPPGVHYVDVSNEYSSFETVLARNADTVNHWQVCVTGAGFGVQATESIVHRLCEGQPSAPVSVRVDVLPSLALEAGTMGAALAGALVESLPAGRRQVRNGKLVTTSFDDSAQPLQTPDGETRVTANFPSGELLAAWRASGAANVISASAEVPSGAVMRVALPALALVARSARARGFLTKRMAGVTLKAQARPHPHSWGHAHVRWSDGRVQEGWLKAEDALDFTAAAATEVALRLARGEGRPGAHTPADLFGAEIAEAAGGQILQTE